MYDWFAFGDHLIHIGQHRVLWLPAAARASFVYKTMTSIESAGSNEHVSPARFAEAAGAAPPVDHRVVGLRGSDLAQPGGPGRNDLINFSSLRSARAGDRVVHNRNCASLCGCPSTSPNQTSPFGI